MILGWTVPTLPDYALLTSTIGSSSAPGVVGLLSITYKQGNTINVSTVAPNTPPMIARAKGALASPPPEPVAIGSRQSAVGNAGLRDAGLIDASMALGWLGSDSDKETSFIAEQATIEAVFASGDELEDLAPTGSIASNLDSAIASSDNVESTAELWLADELLERVFG